MQVDPPLWKLNSESVTAAIVPLFANIDHAHHNSRSITSQVCIYSTELYFQQNNDILFVSISCYSGDLFLFSMKEDPNTELFVFLNN